MLPNLLQQNVFGELKFKLHPKPTNVGQNNFFKKKTVIICLSEKVSKIVWQVKCTNYRCFGEKNGC